MKGFKNKRGISLIVLVITIIVMIILAAAIILSISNSGIMDKANQAKTDSDTANLKEYVNVLEAEWELMDTNERSLSDYSSKEAYVNGKLKDKGYTGALLMEDGTLYTNLQANAKEALQDGIQIGDEVKYTIAEADKKEYTPELSKTGTTNSKLTTQTNLEWIYIGVSDDGELLITPDVSDGVPANSNVALSGKQGWLTGPAELNTVCDKLYTVTRKGTARNMNIDDVTRILGYTGEKGAYYAYDATVGEPNYFPTAEAKKIGELEKKLSEPLSNRYTPESGKNLEDYYSDYYQIYKTDDVKEMKNSKYVNLIYSGSACYWLASSCAKVDLSALSVLFCVRSVDGEAVFSGSLFDSSGADYLRPFAIRPVISLNSDVTLTKSTTEANTWNM